MDSLTQIGIGGIFAILLLREVLGFLTTWRKRNGNGKHQSAGDKPVELWQLEQRTNFSASLRESVVPILERQTKALENLLELMREDRHRPGAKR